jgi:hypothetical protein
LQIRFLFLLLLPEWSDETGFPFSVIPEGFQRGDGPHPAQPSSNRPAAAQGPVSSPLDTDLSFGLSSSKIADEAAADLSKSQMNNDRDMDELLEAILPRGTSDASQPDSVGQCRNEVPLLWFCTSLQSQLMPELDKLQRMLAKAGPRAGTVSQQHSQPSAFANAPSGAVHSQANQTAVSSANASAAQAQGAKKATLPPGVRLLYYNVSNRAIKVSFSTERCLEPGKCNVVTKRCAGCRCLSHESGSALVVAISSSTKPVFIAPVAAGTQRPS